MKNTRVRELVKKSIRGDSRAFEALCEQIVREVVFLCYTEMGSRESGQDAAQEVFIHLQNRITRLRSPDAFNVWLHRIIQTTCSGMHRKAAGYREDLVDSYDDYENDMSADAGLDRLPAAFVEQRANQQALLALVRALPQPYQRCVLLHYYSRLSYGEVASVLGVSVPVVKRYLITARGKLKKELEKTMRQEERHAMLNGIIPAVAFGPGLTAMMENAAEWAVPPDITRACLDAVKRRGGLPGAKSHRGLRVVAILGAALACAACLAGLRFAAMPRLAAAIGGDAGQAATAGQSAPAALPDKGFGWLTIRTTTGRPVQLPQGARAILLDEGGQTLDSAPLSATGECYFKNLDKMESGSYTVRVVDAAGAPVAGFEEVAVNLAESEGATG